ncbi:Cytochrome P450 71A1 [Rhynchospora pubera]|uniref:Cytochrome P450 71A1 n=1 Tax=Rhynchospora pubera TaxID=906938 RepID=A0AAV8EUM5_9POAL|nr:Cytochrome P450 71A1 [Rhynchospora pubera]
MRAREDGTAGFDLSENDTIAIVRDITATATDTTFNTLEWIMSELMKNPNVMAKAQTEIRQIAGKKTMVTEDDLNQIEYIRAVIKEAMRLHPPAPVLVPHESTTTVIIHGYEIPPKTKLIVNAWAIARDPQSWEAPEEFRPERFLGSEVDFRGNDFQFIPFGEDRRMCPAINFAMVTIELAIANLLYSFDWRLPGRDLDMDEGVGLSVPRKNPLYLIATKF